MLTLPSHSRETANTNSPSATVNRFIASAPPPIRVDGLALELGIPISVEAGLANISGKLSRDPNSPSGFRITVNGSHPRRRQRFTIAHEIGHFVLHRDLIEVGLVDDELYRSDLSNDLERQANYFAAQLLLPAEWVRQFYKGEKSLSKLAEIFDVSENALRIRLKELRLAP
jgi:hypothetical protein